MSGRGVKAIQEITSQLIGDGLGHTAHCIGIETGIRLAIRHPEYAQLLLKFVDEEMKEDGCDEGRLDAEEAIDALVRKPLALVHGGEELEGEPR
jgi:hypothetical protein